MNLFLSGIFYLDKNSQRIVSENHWSVKVMGSDDSNPKLCSFERVKSPQRDLIERNS